LRLSASIAIGVKLSGLKEKIASALEKNEKLAPIAIGVEVRSQLETERADRKEIEAELLSAKTKFCSGRQTFPEINTPPCHNSQPASSQRKKLKTDLGNLKAILQILES
jgi:hypothetical protein